MDELWLEVAFDVNNQARVTFSCLKDMEEAESFARILCTRHTGPRFFMRNRKDFIKVLTHWSKILAK